MPLSGNDIASSQPAKGCWTGCPSLRGPLIERILKHRRGCTTCARGDGHRLAVLTVSYPGGRTRQISLHRAQVPEVRGWLANYQQLKEGIEAICELNHDLLRADNAAARSKGTKA